MSMFTATSSPASRVRATWRSNAVQSIAPSGVYGSSVAEMPCTAPRPQREPRERVAERRSRSCSRLPRALDLRAARAFGALAVEGVERVAARDQAVARRRRAVAEGAADALARRAARRRARRPGRSGTRAPCGRGRPRRTSPSRTHACATCGQVLLQVASSPTTRRSLRARRPCARAPRASRRATPHERILRRRDSRRSAGTRGTLHVRRVVGARRRDVEPSVDAERTARARRDAASSGSGRASLDAERRRTGGEVERPRAARRSRRPGAAARTAATIAPRSRVRVGERRPAEAPGARARGEELVQQVAVAVLHVDEVEALLAARGARRARSARRASSTSSSVRTAASSAMPTRASSERMAERDARRAAVGRDQRPLWVSCSPTTGGRAERRRGLGDAARRGAAERGARWRRRAGAGAGWRGPRRRTATASPPQIQPGAGAAEVRQRRRDELGRRAVGACRPSPPSAGRRSGWRGPSAQRLRPAASRRPRSAARRRRGGRARARRGGPGTRRRRASVLHPREADAAPPSTLTSR